VDRLERRPPDLIRPGSLRLDLFISRLVYRCLEVGILFKTPYLIFIKLSIMEKK
jgi:hypothetical protein